MLLMDIGESSCRLQRWVDAVVFFALHGSPELAVEIVVRRVLLDYIFRNLVDPLELTLGRGRVHGLPGEYPYVLVLDLAEKHGSATVDHGVAIVVRLEHMVVAPDWLELAELQLESAIFRLRLSLPGHAFRLHVLEHAALFVREFPSDVAEALVIQIILVFLNFFL